MWFGDSKPIDTRAASIRLLKGENRLPKSPRRGLSLRKHTPAVPRLQAGLRGLSRFCDPPSRTLPIDIGSDGSSQRNSPSSESTSLRRSTGRAADPPTTMVGMKGMRGLGLVVVVNTAGAVIPTILLQLFTPGATSHLLWMNFRFSLVYSYCIGTLAFAVMGGRLTERLHCRSRVWYAAAMLLLD